MCSEAFDHRGAVLTSGFAQDEFISKHAVLREYLGQTRTEEEGHWERDPEVLISLASPFPGCFPAAVACTAFFCPGLPPCGFCLESADYGLKLLKLGAKTNLSIRLQVLGIVSQ